jgi:putative oxidoreductase
VILLIGRLLLCLIFVHEGVVLATHFDGGAKAMAALGVGMPLLVATIALQLAAGLSVGLGLLTRLGAVLLGLFCLATAALFHTNFANQNELLHFQKDLAMAGGMFVLAVAGAGAISLDGFLNGLTKYRAGDGSQKEAPDLRKIMDGELPAGDINLPF